VIAPDWSGRYQALEATGPERARLWARALALFPGYADYQRRAGNRLIPIVTLTRAEKVSLTAREPGDPAARHEAATGAATTGAASR
jgi:hypothetical protein